MNRTFSIRRGSLDEVLQIHRRVPELRPPSPSGTLGTRGTVAEYINKIDGRIHVALVAEIAGVPVGFKLGFGLNPTEFYSWLGGVDPEYRAQGIAQALLLKQECIAAGMGYDVVRVKSMNSYPAMMKLLLSNGYLIVDCETCKRAREAKFSFSKKLA